MARVKGIFNNDAMGKWIAYDEINLEDLLKESKHSDISFITLMGDEKIKHDKIKGFCHAKFRANFLIDTIKVKSLKLQDQLTIGEAIIEVTSVGKSCHRGCPVLEYSNHCAIGEHIFFARVLQDGIVRYNDIAKLI